MAARSATLQPHTVRELRKIVCITWIKRGESSHSSEDHRCYWELLNLLTLERSEEECKYSPDADAMAYLSDNEFEQFLELMPQLPTDEHVCD